jgi:hypothetical protein
VLVEDREREVDLLSKIATKMTVIIYPKSSLDELSRAQTEISGHISGGDDIVIANESKEKLAKCLADMIEESDRKIADKSGPTRT